MSQAAALPIHVLRPSIASKNRSVVMGPLTVGFPHNSSLNAGEEFHFALASSERARR
jgi:hypothetical protein